MWLGHSRWSRPSAPRFETRTFVESSSPGVLRSRPNGRTSWRSACSPTSRAAPRPLGSPGSFDCYLPALLAPFAASLGDRFRRERFLMVMMLLGAIALAASAVAAFAENTTLVFVFAAVVGLVLHPDQTGPAGAAAISGAHARRVDRLEWSDVDDREHRHSRRAALRRRAGVGCGRRARVRFRWRRPPRGLPRCSARVRVESRSSSRAQPTTRASAGSSQPASGLHTYAERSLVVALMVAQSFVRGCLNVLIVVAAFRVLDGGAADVGYLTAAIGVGGLIGAIGR